MKKPNVLNRAMFNRGGTSAYGRGITSNLVSDEQRQKFNDGGRVRADTGMYARPWEIPWDWPQRTWPGSREERGRGPGIGEKRKEAEEEIYKQEFEGGIGQSEQDIFWEDERAKAQLGVNPDYTVGEEGIGLVKRETPPSPDLPPPDPESDVIDWTEFAEGLYDKKSAKGKALLGLAGNVLAASQQPKKEAAAILGKGMGEFGKTFAARKEKMEDIAATGKMYEQIYKTREATKGEQTRESAAAALLGLTGGSAMERFRREIGSLKTDDIKPKQLQTAIFNATEMKISPKIMPPKLEDQVKEAENKDNEGQVYIFGLNARILQNGKFEDISWEDVLKLPERDKKTTPPVVETTPITQTRYR